MIPEFKPLYRSNTQVLIPQKLSEGILDSIRAVGGRKVLLMADRHIAEIPSFTEMRLNLEKSPFSVSQYLVDVKEPDVIWVDEHVSRIKDFKPDIVLGIGGGSLIDLAKAVSVLIYNEGIAAEYQGRDLVKKPGAKKIMVPTTAGTGSEVTPGAVVVNHETGRKGAIGSRFLVPDIAILEPSLTLSMPPIVMAATAMDAITHCLESYVGKAENPFATMYAHEGFAHLTRAFPKVLDNPQDLDARLHMLIGSCMAGFAIFNTDTGACHSMAYPMGTYYNVPHGIANALLIPLVMEHNISHGCYQYEDLYDLIENRDVNVSEAQEKSLALLAWLKALAARTELPDGLGGFSITKDDISRMAEKGLNLKTALNNNPVPFNLPDAVRMLEALVL